MPRHMLKDPDKLVCVHWMGTSAYKDPQMGTGAQKWDIVVSRSFQATMSDRADVFFKI